MVYPDLPDQKYIEDDEEGHTFNVFTPDGTEPIAIQCICIDLFDKDGNLCPDKTAEQVFNAIHATDNPN